MSDRAFPLRGAAEVDVLLWLRAAQTGDPYAITGRELKFYMKLPIEMSLSPALAWRLTLVLTLLAVTHLATTQVEYTELEEINDKVSHVLAFYVLSLLVDFSFPKRVLVLPKALALLGYGAFIEIIQYFLPYRSFSLLDLSADGVGIALYWLSVPALKHLPLFRARWKV